MTPIPPLHDSNIFKESIDEDNTNRALWADSAYRSAETLKTREARGPREHVQRKGSRRCAPDG
jgi:hypothetical protein